MHFTNFRIATSIAIRFKTILHGTIVGVENAHSTSVIVNTHFPFMWRCLCCYDSPCISMCVCVCCYESSVIGVTLSLLLRLSSCICDAVFVYMVSLLYLPRDLLVWRHLVIYIYRFIRTQMQIQMVHVKKTMEAYRDGKRKINRKKRPAVLS